MTAFEVRVDCQQPLALVQIVGDLDISTVPKVKAQLTDVLEEGARDFLIDLTEVGHVDSTGLGFMVWVRQRATERQGRLVLCGQNAHFRKLLTLTGLATLFELSDDVAEARAALASPAPAKPGDKPE